MLDSSLSPLLVQQEMHGLSVVLRVAGELDQVTAPALRANLQTALAAATPPHSLVIDLAEVEFFGSAGLNALLELRRETVAKGVQLRVAAAHKIVLRPLGMTGVDRVLGLYPDVEQALAADSHA
ncbi:STAS domain-containing protein [Lentzea jiangxiensis]|uniref:Anti-sigma factor antagonist n=1 Tax=Lentzea jiangxiensis TaxID=641025 RepID=A0A1H0RQT8_9PSEU|nr:STAS domain-containing protein [Lentzea jiangxiensis]SDP31817.1 anti-anti-sigma factor [Lentzea jiangxiensis]